MVITYDSIDAFLKPAREMGRYQRNYARSEVSYDKCLELTAHGDPSLVPQAESILDQIMVSAPQTRGYRWIDAPSGAYCSIPAYLSGSPVPMRQRQKVSGDYNPIRIFIVLSSSGFINDANILKRGLAVVALVLRLQMSRPIELYAIEDSRMKESGGDYISLIRFNTQPLNLAQAAFCIGHPSFTRGLWYGVVDHNGAYSAAFSNSFSVLGGGSASTKYIAWMHELLDMTPSDLFIPAAYADNNAMVTDPVKWVNTQVARLLDQAPE